MSDAADRGAGRDFNPPTKKTLATCDDEPIHLPGAVQPHGCLFAELGMTVTRRLNPRGSFDQPC